MSRPQSAMRRQDRSVWGATDAKTWRKLQKNRRTRLSIVRRLPAKIRERLQFETGFRSTGLAELENWFISANLAKPFESAPTPERRLAVYKGVQRQTEAFLVTGEGREALLYAVEELQVNYLGGTLRQRGFDLDEFAALLDEETQADRAEFERGVRAFLAEVDNAIEAAQRSQQRRAGRGRPPRLTLYAAIMSVVTVFDVATVTDSDGVPGSGSRGL